LDYYKGVIKNAAERNTQIPAIPAPAQGAIEELPPFVKALKDEGFFEGKALDGRHKLIEGKSDREIILWILKKSGYEASYTALRYHEYIYTKNKLSTIERYTRDCKDEDK
jgi:hypothetical protein